MGVLFLGGGIYGCFLGYRASEVMLNTAPLSWRGSATQPVLYADIDLLQKETQSRIDAPWTVASFYLVAAFFGFIGYSILLPMLTLWSLDSRNRLLAKLLREYLTDKGVLPSETKGQT